MIRVLASPNEFQKYNDWMKDHPSRSLWQSLEWKKYQEALGREVKIYVREKGNEIVTSALVIIDRTMFGFSTWEIPRGPLGLRGNGQLIIDNLFEAIVNDARKDCCMSIYFSPPTDFSIVN
ncbi:aminoacyltransferase, partial [Patescibacteria group bacterium]|nr:aminoacyltransferase [Patescibacteria group bacterium]